MLIAVDIHLFILLIKLHSASIGDRDFFESPPILKGIK